MGHWGGETHNLLLITHNQWKHDFKDFIESDVLTNNVMSYAIRVKSQLTVERLLQYL